MSKVLIDKDLLNDLIFAQHELVENFKDRFGSHIGVGRWNDEINDLIETYNETCVLVGLDKKEIIPHD